VSVVIEIIEAQYQYTEDEKRVLGHTLAELEVRVDGIRSERKVAADRYKERIQALEGDILKLARNLYNGHELRPFKCTVVFDYKNASKIYRGVETKALIEERPMTTDDRQGRFA